MRHRRVRHRRDLGDIASLAASIRDVELLHPIVIRPDGVLIAGERRLEAYKTLGHNEIPVTEVDLDEVARGELAENVARKDFLRVRLTPFAGRWSRPRRQRRRRE
jgi:ParB/RepB/Spo0J family partition protein